MHSPRGHLAVFLSLLIWLPAAASADTKAVFESTGGAESASYAVKNKMVRWGIRRTATEQSVHVV